MKVPLLENSKEIFVFPLSYNYSSRFLVLIKKDERLQVKTYTDLVHSGVVSPSLAGKLSVSWSLCPSYSPVIRPCLPRSQGLSWDPGWSRGGMGLGKAGPLTAVIDSLKVKGVRPGCLVLKDHLE